MAGFSFRPAVAVRLCALGLTALLGSAAALAAPASQIGTSAPHAILIDAESGSVLFEKGADQLVAPASLAKLMSVETELDLVEHGLDGHQLGETCRRNQLVGHVRGDP